MAFLALGLQLMPALNVVLLDILLDPAEQASDCILPFLLVRRLLLFKLLILGDLLQRQLWCDGHPLRGQRRQKRDGRGLGRLVARRGLGVLQVVCRLFEERLGSLRSCLVHGNATLAQPELVLLASRGGPGLQGRRVEEGGGAG